MNAVVVGMWSWAVANLDILATVVVATVGVVIQSRMLGIARDEADRRRRETRWAAWIERGEPSGTRLIIECQGPAAAQDVQVFVDGVRPQEHGSIHEVAALIGTMGPGSRLTYEVTLGITYGSAEAPRYVAVRWSDPKGKRRLFETNL